jgi:hypothetical protein
MNATYRTLLGLRTEGMAQVVEQLLRSCEALSSNPSTDTKKRGYIIKKIQRQPTEWERISNHVSDMGPISRKNS